MTRSKSPLKRLSLAHCVLLVAWDIVGLLFLILNMYLHDTAKMYWTPFDVYVDPFQREVKPRAWPNCEALEGDAEVAAGTRWHQTLGSV